MKRHRFFVGLSSFLCVLFLSCLFSLSPAQEAPRRPLLNIQLLPAPSDLPTIPNLGGVLPSIELLPDPSNLLTIPGLKVRIIQDPERGEVLKVEGSGSGQTEQLLESYNIEVDEEKGTYKVTPIDPSMDPDFGVGLQQQSSPQFYPARYIPVRYMPVSYQYRSWWAGISLGTSDPVGIKLTATKNVLSWTANLWYGYVAGANSSTSVWAANPSSAGTRWYLNSTYDKGVEWEYHSWHGWIPTHYFRATYENWNFNNPYKATYVKHRSQLWGYPDGNYGYDWAWERWGEAYSGLKISVVRGYSY